jgi:hypothetical protein
VRLARWHGGEVLGGAPVERSGVTGKVEEGGANPRQWFDGTAAEDGGAAVFHRQRALLMD